MMVILEKVGSKVLAQYAVIKKNNYLQAPHLAEIITKEENVMESLQIKALLNFCVWTEKHVTNAHCAHESLE